MSDRNVEIVRDAFAAFNRGGPDAFIPYTHPEGEFITPSELATEPDTYRGHEGARRYWDSFYEVMEEIKVDPHTLHDWGSEIVVAEMLLTALRPLDRPGGGTEGDHGDHDRRREGLPDHLPPHPGGRGAGGRPARRHAPRLEP